MKELALKNLITFLIFALISFSTNAADTYEKIAKGKSCNAGFNQKIDCNYKIGESFWLQIIGVGEPEATVVFMKSDYQGAYYAKIGKMHGCVIVQPNFKSGEVLDVAFISPKTGKIYKAVEDCYRENKT
jgi:hypothetical protein